MYIYTRYQQIHIILLKINKHTNKYFFEANTAVHRLETHQNSASKTQDASDANARTHAHAHAHAHKQINTGTER